MAAVGTLAWSLQTGGRLGRQDRLRLIAQAMLARIAALPSKLRRRLGIDAKGIERVNIDRIRVPDTRAASEALELCSAVSSPALRNHCLRTYLWGALLSSARSLGFDEELFYISCLLHDLGLTQQHNGKEPRAHCFAVEGAYAARDFAAARGWSETRSDALFEAISLHLNVRVDLGCGVEAHLLHEGAALDVIGARLEEIAPADAQAVLARHPRLGLKRELHEAMKLECRKRPQSRGHFLYEAGFGRMIKRAPFAD
jgi:hypothetical protein